MKTEPYRIVSATLTKYSGEKVEIEIESEVYTTPVKLMKEKILDAICKTYNSEFDPFVRIELKTKKLFNL